MTTNGKWESGESVIPQPRPAATIEWEWAAGESGPVAVDVYVAAGPAGIKTVQGLAIANVKTMHGLAIASVKTIHGAA